MTCCVRSHYRFLRCGIFLSLLLGLTAGALAAQDSVPPPPPDSAIAGRAVRVSDVKGKVQVWQDGQVVFDQAEPNMPAMEGMRFTTGNDGRLEIEFEDGSVARLAPNSSFRLTELHRNADGSAVTQIQALSGLSYYELASGSGQVSVDLGQDAATPVGNAIFRIDLDGDPSQLAVMQGEVHIEDGEGVSVDVHPNQTFQADLTQPGEFTIADSVTADSWDQWNSDRDQDLAQMESDETSARASTNDPDDASWNDLDYYGSWYNVPGYGDVWSPSDVGANWDPYDSGYWGNYGGVGYVWISSYPWGWLPYHCGTWDYLDGTGWFWIPGNCGWGVYGSGWYPYAGIWHGPEGYVPPLRPHRPGPKPPQLIAIRRAGSEMPIHTRSGIRVQPRPLTFNGALIEPMAAELHPQQRGPLGESFTTTVLRAHPEWMRPGAAVGLRVPGTPLIHETAPRMPAARPFGSVGARPAMARPVPAPRTPATPRDLGRPHR